MKVYTLNLDRDTTLQYSIGLFCLIVYCGALFFPLMDKDAAHHANIALHMLQYNDYTSLVDRQTDYLDKPHFLFWISALSFKIFGVNTFAYRLPALLCALVAIFSTYRLALHLSGKTTAKLAAIILATAQGFIISINDARMETPLTAAIIFGLWNLIVFIDKRKLVSILFAALGAAIAFSTKGWIGPAIIFLSAFFYILFNKKWKILAYPKTWLFIPFFVLFISPVLYAYYLQYDLHPEKVVRNMTHISGIKFILWDQNFERFGGDNFIKGGRNSSVFFLYHTFLWAFLPWCLAAYLALFFWLRRIFYRKKWRNPFNFSAVSFAVVLFTISFSRFKMPHYIFMLLPLAALFTAPYLRLVLSYKKATRFFYTLHMIFAALIILAVVVLNYYFFPPEGILLQAIIALLLLLLLLVLVKRFWPVQQKFVYVSVLFVLVFNFCLNYNFFPSLMKYQGGNQLAKQMRLDHTVVPDSSIMLLEVNAHSFDFYRSYNHAIVDITQFEKRYPDIRNNYFLLSSVNAKQLRAENFIVRPVASHLDYNVARMKLKFLNPATRQSLLDTLMLARIYRE